MVNSILNHFRLQRYNKYLTCTNFKEKKRIVGLFFIKSVLKNHKKIEKFLIFSA